jgi:hypothetical protein
MNPNLVPTSIVDKNGKRTTVRRKPAQAAADQKALPVPAASSEPLKHAPTEDQLAQKMFEHIQPARNIDWEVAELTGTGKITGTEHYRTSFVANDEQAYAVLSVTGNGNASALLASGIRGAEEATAFLIDNGLERVVVDNTGLTDEALRRGLSAKHLMRFLSDHDQAGHDPKVIVDAAVMSSKDRHEAVMTPTPAMMVLRGEVDLSQLEEVEMRYIDRADDRKHMLRTLKEIKAGESAYDIKRLGQYLDSNKFNIGKADAIILADTIGMDRAMMLEDKNLAYQSLDSFRKCGITEGQLADAALFHDRFNMQPNRSGIRDSMALFKAGVDPVKAASLRVKRLSVESIIEADQLGVHTSITEGFL